MTENRFPVAKSHTTIPGACGVLGGVVLMIPTPDRDAYGFAFFNAANVVAFLLLMVAIAGLARAGIIGRGLLGRVATIGALAGLAGFAVVEAATRVDDKVGETFHPITVPLLAISMILLGIAVIRHGAWRGWRQFAPLLCGVVPFAVELPTFVFFGPNAAVIALTWACWALLGAALMSAPYRHGDELGGRTDVPRHEKPETRVASSDWEAF